MGAYRRFAASPPNPQGVSRAELVVLSLAALALAFQLFVPPRVGLGDNGDFNRTMGASGSAPRPGPSATSATSSPATPTTRPTPRRCRSSRPRSSSSGWPGRHRAHTRSSSFDIAPLAAVHALALLGALWLLMRAARGLPPAARWTAAGLLALAFTDVGYAAYLNSFYSEPASLVFFLCAVGPGRDPGGNARLRILAALAAFLVLFVAAKPQNFAAALPLAALVARLSWLRGDRRWRMACAATVAAALATSALMFARGYPVAIREQGLQLSVFYWIQAARPIHG